MRAGEEDHPAHPRAARLHPDQLRPRRSAAAQHHRPARPLRGRGEGGHRAGVVPPLQRDPPALPRPADGEHRRRAQHDQRQHAHRGAAASSRRASRRSCRASRRSSPSSRRSSSAPTSALEKQALELEEKARLLEEQNTQGRGEEPRGRAGPRLAGGEGRAALAHLQVQVRVPRQHVATSCARRSTACSSSPSCSPTTRTRTSPTSRSSTRRPSTPSGGDLLTLINEILDLSKVEAGKMQVEPRNDRARRRRASSSSGSFRPVAEQKGLEFTIEVDEGAPDAHPHRSAAPAAGAQEPARQRLQVHRSGLGHDS